MKNILTISLLLTCALCFGQNLVPNPSFENLNWCPNYIDDIFSIQGWTSFGGTPDIYSTCNADTQKGVPINFAGFQEPASGNNYAGLMSFEQSIPWYEYYAARLTTPLTIGVKYYASIKVSLTECSSYATNNLGIGFSTDSFQITFVMPQDSMFHYAKVNSTSIISDSTHWTTISGSFISDSAYNYIIIGNFNGYHVTDTVFRSNLCLYDIGYYFLDDICLTTDSFPCTFPVGTHELEQNAPLKIYPNPFSTKLTFTLPDNKQATVSLYNFIGQQILQQAFTNSTTINTEQLAGGIYFYELRNDKGVLKTGKVVKQ